MSREKPSTQHAVRILTFHVLPKAFLGRRQRQRTQANIRVRCTKSLPRPQTTSEREHRNAGDLPVEGTSSPLGESPAFRSEDIRSYSDVQLAPRLLASPRMNHTWNGEFGTACLGEKPSTQHAVRILTFHVLPKAFLGRRQRQRTQAEHQSTIEYLQTEMPEISQLRERVPHWENLRHFGLKIFDRTLMSSSLQGFWHRPE